MHDFHFSVEPTAEEIRSWHMGMPEDREIMARAVEQDRLLSQEDVDALPAGTRVLVLWGGGNGPHRYTIKVNRWGGRYFQDDLSERLGYENEQVLVGMGRVGRYRYRHLVALVDAEADRRISDALQEAAEG